MRDTPIAVVRTVLVSLIGCVVLLPATAQAVSRSCGTDGVANTANVLCAAPSGPCTATSVTMSASIEVTGGGCLFDLGGRALQVQKTFQMAGTGFIRFVNAGNVTITDTGKLKARGDFVQPNGFIIQGGLISIASSGTITLVDGALIDVAGDASGTIRPLGRRRHHLAERSGPPGRRHQQLRRRGRALLGRRLRELDIERR